MGSHQQQWLSRNQLHVARQNVRLDQTKRDVEFNNGYWIDPTKIRLALKKYCLEVAKCWNMVDCLNRIRLIIQNNDLADQWLAEWWGRFLHELLDLFLHFKGSSNH